MNSLDAKDPGQLASAAQKMAQSSNAADHQKLRQALGSSEFLLRLNSAQDYGRLRAEQLRLAAIVQALATNTAPAAAATIAFLAGNSDFLAEEARQELLLRAAAKLRPAPAELVQFFNVQTRPDASNLHLGIDSIVANGSESAIALLERKLADADQEPENITGWMRDSILRHRQDVPLVAASERLLKGDKLSTELKTALIEALFDYRPDEWYPPDSDLPRPPERRQASAEARAILRRIGEWASRQESLPSELRTRVRTELELLK